MGFYPLAFWLASNTHAIVKCRYLNSAFPRPSSQIIWSLAEMERPAIEVNVWVNVWVTRSPDPIRPSNILKPPTTSSRPLCQPISNRTSSAGVEHFPDGLFLGLIEKRKSSETSPFLRRPAGCPTKMLLYTLGGPSLEFGGEKRFSVRAMKSSHRLSCWFLGISVCRVSSYSSFCDPLHHLFSSLPVRVSWWVGDT